MVSPTLAHSVYQVIKYGTFFGLFMSLVVLIIGSILVHDTYYISKHPKQFLSETLVMGILAGAPILYISWLRKAPAATSVIEFFIFFVKLMLLHIGFQLSGVYSVLFPYSKDPINQ
jgi:hypothetical protein